MVEPVLHEGDDPEDEEYLRLQSEVEKTKRIQFMQKMILKEEKYRQEHFNPIIDCDDLYLESDIFPAGLPEVLS